MKILLVSVKAGFGHHSTAQALISCFESKGIECEMIDLFQCVNKFLDDGIQDGYLFLTKYMAKIYGKTYDQMAKKDKPYDDRSMIQIFNKMISKKVENVFRDYGADLIIGTHSFAAMVMTILNEREVIQCPIIGVVTDFTVHPLWESTRLDYYVTPDKLLNRQMMNKGIDEKKILPIGIPVKAAFSEKIPKQEARRQLGIQDITTVLVMMGSMGFGDMSKFLESVVDSDADFQVLCVCGNNKKAKKQIDLKQWSKPVYNYGFVTNVDVLMDAADVLITKPGGLTTSEALAKGLPCIITNPIPGQEDRNMEFLVNAGAAIQVSKSYGVDEALYQIFHSEWRLDALNTSVSHIGKPHSAENLYKFISENIFGGNGDNTSAEIVKESVTV